MALVLKDRVRQTSTTAGTGTLTLSGSVTGYQAFSVIGSGNTTYYTITDAAGNWEVGLGTYTSPNQLSRNTVYESSNANALVNFSSASKDVFVTFPAEGFSSPPAIGGTAPNAITGTNVLAKNRIIAQNDTSGGYTAILEVDNNGNAIIGGAIDAVNPIAFPISAPGGFLFGDITSGNFINFNAAPTSQYSLILPPAAGSNNQLLKTDGSGNLDWTAVQINTDIQIPPVTVGNAGIGVLEMVDGLDGYDYLNIYTYDPGGNVQVKFPAGIYVTGGIDIGIGVYTGGNAFFLGTGGGTSGNIALRGGTVPNDITIQAPASPSIYTLTLPTTAGSNNQVLKTDGSGNLDWVTQGVQGTSPVTVTTATHTVAATTQWLIANRAGTVTLTLPTASSNTGRSLNVKTITANTVVSNASNVVPLAGGAASTAILAATAGKFATLVSDGTNWIIMAAG